AGRYHVDVHLDGGMFGRSKQAKYQILHAGAIDTVMVDQASASGFVSLGEFDFAGTGDEHVMLADNTGEPASTQTQVAFDAVRVMSLDGGGGGDQPGGCCETSRDARGTGVLCVVVAIGLRRRRRA